MPGSSDAGPTPSWSTSPSTPCGSIRYGISFSVVQRKVLTPNDFADLADVAKALGAFERRYEQTATPFE